MYRSIARKRNLFIQAPTGVGKTLSTIYPSLKAMGEGHGEKLFYLTAKTITRSVAEEAFSILRRRGISILIRLPSQQRKNSASWKSRTAIPRHVPGLRATTTGSMTLSTKSSREVDGITRDKVLEYAERFEICPFEFCLDISNWVDGIICDYNYVFDPNVKLKRYFDQGSRARGTCFWWMRPIIWCPGPGEMYSASLIKEDVLLAKRILKTQPGRQRSLPSWISATSGSWN